MANRCIHPSSLVPADIIVTTGDAMISSGIRTATGHPVSHAMLYIGNGRIVEALGEGVREVPIAEALAEATLAIALRRDGLTNVAARAVVDFVRRQVGAGYDTAGIVAQLGYQIDRYMNCRVWQMQDCETRAARNNLWLQSEDAFFCSELIAAGFEQAGHRLIDGPPAAASPGTFMEVTSTGKLLYVGHLRGG